MPTTLKPLALPTLTTGYRAALPLLSEQERVDLLEWLLVAQQTLLETARKHVKVYAGASVVERLETEASRIASLRERIMLL